MKPTIKIFMLGITLGFLANVAFAQPLFKFAVIGDFGGDSQAEADVAALVNSWNVEFIVTVGDNYYGASDGNYSDSWNALDDGVGKYYHNWIKPYLGSYGSGSLDTNRFFPALGNHDWYHLDSCKIYTDYFDLAPFSTTSGNDRYYDFKWGNVHFFMLSTYGDGLTEYNFPRHGNYGEPDGVLQDSKQAQWCKTQLENADPSEWKIIITHHPPYSSSSQHGSESAVQWPYKQWGANLVLAGHDHTYERLNVDDFTYIVNGLGGESTYSFGTPVAGSEVRYSDDYGAMLCEVYNDSLNLQFISRSGLIIDNYTLSRVFSLELSPSNQSVSDSSGSTSFSLTSNTTWNVSDDASWLNVNPASGSGNSTLTATYEANPTTSQRIGRITVTGGGITDTVTVTQSPKSVSSLDRQDFDPINDFDLAQNYPNPFNPSTTINFSVPHAANVKLIIYDPEGQEIVTLLDEYKQAGNYELKFDSTNLSAGDQNLPSGIYFYKLSTPEHSITKKMILLK
jgi:tartrate-resistant acid phosphatase type 5